MRWKAVMPHWLWHQMIVQTKTENLFFGISLYRPALLSLQLSTNRPLQPSSLPQTDTLTEALLANYGVGKGCLLNAAVGAN